MADEDTLSRDVAEKTAWHALPKDEATARLGVDPGHGLDRKSVV
jgi:hypothetical protein